MFVLCCCCVGLEDEHVVSSTRTERDYAAFLFIISVDYNAVAARHRFRQAHACTNAHTAELRVEAAGRNYVFAVDLLPLLAADTAVVL